MRKKEGAMTKDIEAVVNEVLPDVIGSRLYENRAGYAFAKTILASALRSGKLVVPLSIDELMQASALAYCSDRNKHKVRDADLLVDICTEIHQAMMKGE